MTPTDSPFIIAATITVRLIRLPLRIGRSLLRPRQIEMLNGEKATLSYDGSGLMVDGATVVGADIPTSNGVIHIIDGVLIP